MNRQQQQQQQLGGPDGTQLRLTNGGYLGNGSVEKEETGPEHSLASSMVAAAGIDRATASSMARSIRAAALQPKRASRRGAGEPLGNRQRLSPSGVGAVPSAGGFGASSGISQEPRSLHVPVPHAAEMLARQSACARELANAAAAESHAHASNTLAEIPAAPGSSVEVEGSVATTRARSMAARSARDSRGGARSTGAYDSPGSTATSVSLEPVLMPGPAKPKDPKWQMARVQLLLAQAATESKLADQADVTIDSPPPGVDRLRKLEEQIQGTGSGNSTRDGGAAQAGSSRQVSAAPAKNHSTSRRHTMRRMVSSGVKASQLSRIAAARYDAEVVEASKRKQAI